MADSPQIICIGGASASGKSTIARRLADELDAHLIPTDMVRAALRAASTPKDDPIMHAESFDGPGSTPDHWNVDSFAQQADRVLAATAAMCAHGLREGWDPIIVEGVHVIPGRVEPVLAAAGPTAVHVHIVAEPDPEAHKAMIVARGDATAGGRAADHYLNRFDRVREVQAYLCECAASAGVAIDTPDAAMAALTSN